MSLYNLWLFACASLAVASGGLALFEVGVALAESGLDRRRKRGEGGTSQSQRFPINIH